VLADPGDKPSLFVRYRVAVAAGALCLALVLAVVLTTPIVVRGALNKRAQQAGAVVEVRSIRVGWGAIWLLGVKVSVPQLPSALVEIDSVRVVPSFSGGVKRVEAMGGTLQLKGSRAELTEQWRRWRGQTTAPAAASGESGPQLKLSGLRVQWSSLEKDAVEASIWGLSAARDAQTEQLAFDLAKVTGRGLAIEAKSGQATWRRGDSRAMQSVNVADLVASVDLESLPQLLTGLAPQSTALAPSGAASSSPPPQPGLSRLNELKDQLASWLQTGWADGASLQLPKVQTQLRVDDQVLNVGPARCTAERKADNWKLRFIPGSNATSETLAFDVTVPLQSGATRISLSGGPVGLDVLGVREGDFGLQRVHDIRLSARSLITLPAASAGLDVAAEGQLDHLSFLQPKLASDVVNADLIGWSVRANWTPEQKLLRVPEGRVELGQIKALLTGELQLDPGNPGAKLNLEIPLVSCQNLFDSVPSSLLPTLRGARLGGTFSLSAALDVQVVALKDMKFNWSIKNDCRISAVPADITPERFRQPFQYQIIDAAGLPLVRESGPMSRDWVPFDQISPYLESAAIICEDSRFYSHHGIDEKAIELAFVANVQAGRFVRGASTISMQLAKNLYLGHEKTLSRKLQEAVLTLLLEQQLTKQQILELYFNVIEFGPDIWGIRAAADYYFGIEPKDLSLGQALYLASILPNPHDPHAQGDGTLTPKWAAYMQKLMHIAHKIKRIDDQELEQGLKEIVRVGLGRPLPPLPDQAPPPLGAEPGQLPESLPSANDLNEVLPPKDDQPQ
jgi:hypothetical protein